MCVCVYVCFKVNNTCAFPKSRAERGGEGTSGLNASETLLQNDRRLSGHDQCVFLLVFCASTGYSVSTLNTYCSLFMVERRLRSHPLRFSQVVNHPSFECLSICAAGSSNPLLCDWSKGGYAVRGVLSTRMYVLKPRGSKYVVLESIFITMW